MSLFRRPSGARAWVLAALWGLYAVMWLGGVGSYVLLGGVRAGDEWAAPLFLTLAAILVLAPARAGAATALAVAGFIGFLLEWVGLHGRWVFGEYAYTGVLAPKLLGVPLVMISAWLVLVAYAHEILRERRWLPAVKVLAGAAVLTAIDLVIDPLAAGPLGYWTWPGGGAYHGVPAHNFAGWFGGGLVILTLLHAALGDGAASPTAPAVGLSIVVFFTVLAVFFGLTLPALAGAVLCAAHVVIVRTRAHAGRRGVPHRRPQVDQKPRTFSM